ncbi:hypothetical protein L1987_19698 [Smallanthus sonchifolius]|uniref:Uncharacterized protein n=1 Tax=Smallanthus sonchifolius TaxID=185202 RepID=A0ACB9IQ07_9ASTR|nr:hypothetical protein L1987_19698 [Smallanthus sonchifolius]
MKGTKPTCTTCNSDEEDQTCTTCNSELGFDNHCVRAEDKDNGFGCMETVVLEALGKAAVDGDDDGGSAKAGGVRGTRERRNKISRYAREPEIHPDCFGLRVRLRGDLSVGYSIVIGETKRIIILDVQKHEEITQNQEKISIWKSIACSCTQGVKPGSQNQALVKIGGCMAVHPNARPCKW